MVVTTVVDVKGNLNLLKKAVSSVSKADKAWLTALETFLESIDTSSQATPVNNARFTSLGQAVRVYLDELSFQQIADNKLEIGISQKQATSEDLSTAIKQAEAYIVVTHEAFEFLQGIVSDITFTIPDGVKADLQIKAAAAWIARYGSKGLAPAGNIKVPEGLAPLVARLQNQKGAVLSANEPEGTDLLLGNTAQDDNEFLLLLKKQGNQVTFEQTQKLFKNKRFALTNQQIIRLTQSWGQVIKDLIKDSSKAEADLILIHNLLETLYDRLESNIRRVSEDIVVELESPDI
jgi:hypothetical protein